MRVQFEESKYKIILDQRNIKETPIENTLKVNFNDSIISSITFDKFNIKESEDVKDVKVLMLKGEKGDSGVIGDYTTINNKPKINGVELNGNLNSGDLGLASAIDVSNLEQEKVDKETGKGLSSNDYTTAEKTKLSNIEEGATRIIVDSALSSTSENPVQNKVIKEAIEELVDDYTTELAKKVDSETFSVALDGKVDKEQGKTLSSNDFTNEEKTKLESLMPVSDIRMIHLQNEDTIDLQLLLPSSDPYQDLTTGVTLWGATDGQAGVMTCDQKVKLDTIEEGAQHNIQSDWDETDESSDAYIRNKPFIPEGAVVDTELSTTSTNPVQNKVITSALEGKTNPSDVRGLISSYWQNFILMDIIRNSTKVDIDIGDSYYGDYVASGTIPQATTTHAGVMSASDKAKLDGIETGAEVNSITGVKGNAESTYRTGNVNLTPANIGAVPNTQAGMNAAINLLSVGDSNATMNDYILAQYVNGGTTTTTYHRRPLSKLLTSSNITSGLGYTPVNKSGDTMTGKLTMSGSTGTDIIGITNGTVNTDTMIQVERSDVGVGVRLGVGSGGVNHGVWSTKLGEWMMYGDASNVYLNGNAATADKLNVTKLTATYTSNSYVTETDFNRMSFYQVGNLVVANVNLNVPTSPGTTNRTIGKVTFPSTPPHGLYLTIASQNNKSSLLFGIDTNGNITIYSAGEATGFYRASGVMILS